MLINKIKTDDLLLMAQDFALSDIPKLHNLNSMSVNINHFKMANIGKYKNPNIIIQIIYTAPQN